MIGLFELEEVVNAPKQENLVLVDCLNLAFRFKHRKKTDFAAEFLRTISSLGKSYGARQVVLLADLKQSSYRLDISDDYKGNRKELYKNQTPEEEQFIKEFFEGYEKALELASQTYPLLRLKNVEADDLAAYITNQVKANYGHVWLISSDGDWDLLLDGNVSRFSFVTRREYTLDNFYDNHGCDTPEQFISLKVLQGDMGDNIVGVPNVGAKRAYNLVVQYGDAMSIYEQMPIEGSQKFIQEINNSGDLIIKNYQLMDLESFCADAIAFPDSGNISKVQEFIKCLK